VFGLVFCGIVAGLFAAAGWTVPAILLCIAGTTAIFDLTVIGLRARRRRRLHRPDAMGSEPRQQDRNHSGSYLP